MAILGSGHSTLFPSKVRAMQHVLFLAASLSLAGCGQSPMAVANKQITQPGQQRESKTQAVAKGSIETGRVSWLRNLDEAGKIAKATDKPILLLFQEIPG